MFPVGIINEGFKAMPDERVRVIAYSSCRGEETPKKFFLHSKQIEVVEILGRWIEEGSVNKATKRFFRVKGSEGPIYKIYCDNEGLEWFLKTED
jgi:hypothetical protein